MRQFIKRALQKLNKMTDEQIRNLLISSVAEVDRLGIVFDSLAVGILVCDTEHNLIMSNKCAEWFLPTRPLRYESENKNKEPIWSLVLDENIADFIEQTLLSNDRVEEKEFDVEIKGKQRLISMSVLPLVQDRHVKGSLIYIEDITEKRSQEARQRRMESLASLTTLAAGIAHEIKNPLGSLSIHIQLIQKTMNANQKLYYERHGYEVEEKGQKEQSPVKYFELLNKYIAVVNEEINRLNGIVVDFLFAVRPMDMNFRNGNINTVIKELLEFVKFELENAQISYNLVLEEIPDTDFDERFIKQALLNLIKNAIAAMPHGGNLIIKTKANEGEIEIRINDTGCGIPEEHLSKIFAPYFTTKETGSGLGLTLVFKIIREHQGEITVKSKVGEGSCFTITLPIPQKEQRLIKYNDIITVPWEGGV